MLTRDDLRDELEVLLGAARSLSPDTDSYLAETFLSRIERQRTLRMRLSMPALRIRRRLIAVLLALALLAIGTPLTIREYAGSSPTSCVPTIVKIYPSMAAAHADRSTMHANGY